MLVFHALVSTDKFFECKKKEVCHHQKWQICWDWCSFDDWQKDETRQSSWSKGALSRAVEFEKASKMNKDKSAEIKKWIMLI